MVESAALPLLRVLGPEAAQVFADLHRAHGVRLHLDVTLDRIRTGNGRADGIVLAGGAEIDADAVLIAVGATPNVELAAAAGLAVDDGVLVDASFRTSDPDIFAVGDIACHQHPCYEERIRVEHWAAALNQPATAAAAMLGNDASYDTLPYFYTDQYDLGMEYVGHTAGGYDEVVFRGGVAGREFIAFWLRDRRVVAAMNVNIWEVTTATTALIRSRAIVDPDRLADAAVELEELTGSVGSIS